MYALKLTDDYNDFFNCTKKNDDNNMIPQYLPLSIPSGVFLFSLIGLI